jgi:hypothetical protein
MKTEIRRWALWSAAAVVGLLLPAGAGANGAFPESQRVFVPADRGGEILLATNFGIISGNDDGQRWDWVCEHDDGVFGSRYDRGPGPTPRLYVVIPAGLAFSDDGACTWDRSPELEGAQVRDVFADQSAPGRLWVVAQKRVAGALGPPEVYLSTDGAVSFGAARYRADVDAEIQGIESARSDPRRVYLTIRHPGAQSRVEVLRSSDGGGSWTTFDVSADTSRRPLLIAGVDPVDPDRVYFRLLNFPDERFALSVDGGQTVTVPLTVAKGMLTAFVRRADGTLIVGALESGNQGALYASGDGGLTFTRLLSTIRPRALAEREGHLYAATDNSSAGDGFALATSIDGVAWRPLARYQDVAGVKSCGGSTTLAATCSALCSMLLAPAVFRPEICPGPDGGVDASTAPPPASAHGCGCRVGGRSGAQGRAGISVVVVASMVLVRRFTRRRSAARTRRPGDARPAA